MSYWMAYFTGLLLALMVSFNGLLSVATNTYVSSLIFHGIGLIIFTLLLLYGRSKKNNMLHEFLATPLILVLPGLLSSLTIILSNVAMSALGVSLLVGVSLLGQVTASFFIDGYGLLGKEKSIVSSRQLFGTGVMLLGVWFLL